MDNEKKLNFDELENGLQRLKGTDFEEAESIERQLGNLTPVISLSSSFLARLAAIALETVPQNIKSLPLGEYNDVISRTSNFLFAPSAEKMRSQRLEKLQ